MDLAPGEALTRIESHLTHLERQLDQLNQIVIEQGRELARLKTYQQRLAQSVEAAERLRIDRATTRPPHHE